MLALPLLLLAATPTTFGAPGTYAPGGGLTLTHQTFTPPEGPYPAVSELSISASPRVDYFVLRNVAVTVGAEARFRTAKYDNSLGFGAWLGAAYYAELARGFGLFPRFGFGYQQDLWRTAFLGARDYTTRSLTVAAELPVMVFFGRIFVSFGPRVERTVWSRAWVEGFDEGAPTGRTSSLQASTSIGGWFD